jgi:hypothetical protein
MNAFTNKVDEEIWLERNASDYFLGGALFESWPELSCLGFFCSFPQSLAVSFNVSSNSLFTIHTIRRFMLRALLSKPQANTEMNFVWGKKGGQGGSGGNIIWPRAQLQEARRRYRCPVAD